MKEFMISFLYTLKRILQPYQMSERIRKNIIHHKFSHRNYLDKLNDNNVYISNEYAKTFLMDRLNIRIYSSINMHLTNILFDYWNWERKVTRKQLQDAYEKL